MILRRANGIVIQVKTENDLEELQDIMHQLGICYQGMEAKSRHINAVFVPTDEQLERLRAFGVVFRKATRNEVGWFHGEDTREYHPTNSLSRF